jgi:putative phosphotransacetylase
MTILGPVRKNTQIEVSLTDTRALGLVAPIRESGDIEGSASVTIKGPKGEAVLSEGVIVAKRHIHFSPDEAAEYGVSDKQIVYVKLDSDCRSIVYGDVVVRVHKDFRAAMHIDTDEANAAGVSCNVFGEIIDIK